MLQLHKPYRNENEILNGNNTLHEAVAYFDEIINGIELLAQQHNLRAMRQTMLDTVNQWAEEADAEQIIDVESIEYKTAAEKALELQAALNNPSNERAFKTAAEYIASFNADQKKVAIQILNYIELSSSLTS